MDTCRKDTRRGWAIDRNLMYIFLASLVLAFAVAVVLGALLAVAHKKVKQTKALRGTEYRKYTPNLSDSSVSLPPPHLHETLIWNFCWKNHPMKGYRGPSPKQHLFDLPAHPNQHQQSWHPYSSRMRALAWRPPLVRVRLNVLQVRPHTQWGTRPLLPSERSRARLLGRRSECLPTQCFTQDKHHHHHLR